MFGWLLLYDTYRHLVFYNPFTSDIYKLLVLPYMFETLCFSAPPTSPDCMVAGFSEGLMIIHFVAWGQSWSLLNLDFGIANRHSFCFATSNGRDLYVICNKGTTKCFQKFGDRKL